MNQTLQECVLSQWEGMLEALDFTARKPEAVALLNTLTESWAQRSLLEPPRWSGLTEDCSPLEYSMVVSKDGPDLRVLVEAQADPACPRTYWQAGVRLTETLQREWGCRPEILEKILAHFIPSRPDHEVFGCMWHGAWVRRDGRPLFRLYLGAQASQTLPLAVCGAALNDVGAGPAWTEFARHLSPKHEILGMAFDLPRLREPPLQSILATAGLSLDWNRGSISRRSQLYAR